MNTPLPTRTLAGRAVSAIGLGCMNLNHAYGEPPATDYAVRLLERACELGVTHFDTASLYGFGKNEELVARILPAWRSRIFLASKCGMTGVDGKRVIDGRPETLKRTVVESLQRLGTDHIDLYYLHRWDKQVPIEESMGALADMVRAGQIGAIGLSEVSATTLRKAHAVHPVAAVQSEYSLWARNAEVAVLEACRELGVAYVAFSPVGRGFLAQPLGGPESYVKGDIRQHMPRFMAEHWDRNAVLYARYAALAAEAGCTPAQLALVWLLEQAPHVLPIPGTSSIEHLEEDIAAASLKVDPALLAAAGEMMHDRHVGGARYAAQMLSEVDTEVVPD